jgi:hypothetical protein
MDPHLVQDHVEHEDYLYEDWLNCEAEDISITKKGGRRAGMALAMKQQDEIKIKEQDRLTYHCT